MINGVALKLKPYLPNVRLFANLSDFDKNELESLCQPEHDEIAKFFIALRALHKMNYRDTNNWVFDDWGLELYTSLRKEPSLQSLGLGVSFVAIAVCQRTRLEFLRATLLNILREVDKDSYIYIPTGEGFSDKEQLCIADILAYTNVDLPYKSQYLSYIWMCSVLSQFDKELVRKTASRLVGNLTNSDNTAQLLASYVSLTDDAVIVGDKLDKMNTLISKEHLGKAGVPFFNYTYGDDRSWRRLTDSEIEHEARQIKDSLASIQSQ